MRLRGSYKFPDGRDWQWEKLGLIVVGGVMFSKTSIRLSADGWSYSPSLFVWPEVTQPWGLLAL